MLDVEDSRLESGMKVVCAVPGRIRLRSSGSSREVLNAVAKQLQQQNDGYSVLKNQQTGSLLITFDPNQGSLSQLLELLQNYGVSGVSAPSPEASHVGSEPDAWRKAQTQLQSFIPMIAGLLTTRQLGIHGWRAIPVYMVITSTVRQVMENIDCSGAAPPTGTLFQEIAAEFNSNLGSEVETEEFALQPSSVAHSIVHAIPGRMRFRVPRIAEDSAYAQQLEQLLQDDALITGVRVNPATASLVITYEPGVCSEAEMSSYLVDLIQTARGATVPEPAIANPAMPSPQETSEKDSTGEELPQPIMSEEVTDTVETTTVTVDGSPQGASEVGRDDMASPEETKNFPEPVTSTPVSPWSRFKSAALSTMLKMMANQPALET